MSFCFSFSSWGSDLSCSLTSMTRMTALVRVPQPKLKDLLPSIWIHNTDRREVCTDLVTWLWGVEDATVQPLFEHSQHHHHRRDHHVRHPDYAGQGWPRQPNHSSFQNNNDNNEKSRVVRSASHSQRPRGFCHSCLLPFLPSDPSLRDVPWRVDHSPRSPRVQLLQVIGPGWTECQQTQHKGGIAFPRGEC